MSCPLEHMAACAPFLLGGEGRSDTFPSLRPLSHKRTTAAWLEGGLGTRHISKLLVLGVWQDGQSKG